GQYRLWAIDGLRSARRADDSWRSGDGESREPRPLAADGDHRGGLADEDRRRQRRTAACDRDHRAEMSDLKDQLADFARRQGFVRMAVAAAEEDAEARSIALERVRQGSFAGLPWFDEARVIRATDPKRTLPEARS